MNSIIKIALIKILAIVIWTVIEFFFFALCLEGFYPVIMIIIWLITTYNIIRADIGCPDFVADMENVTLNLVISGVITFLATYWIPFDKIFHPVIEHGLDARGFLAGVIFVVIFNFINGD